MLLIFQPALPMRGVTGTCGNSVHTLLISTRTPHAGSDLETIGLGSYRLISTRTPHAGSDQRSGGSAEFEPISTRTPHAGSDHVRGDGLHVVPYFNPHSPCGE